MACTGFSLYPPAVLRGLFAVPSPLPARYGSSAPRVRAWRARQRALAAAVLLASLTPAYGFDRTWTEPTGELTCRVWSLPRRQTAVQHRAFVCVSASSGTLIGAGLRRDGSVRCALTGLVTAGCIYLRGCGYDEVTCD